ncbi:MAG: 50S ribosomal protein L35 [bacterium]|nr:50S ribosomal protein L35 [bacterium]
MPKIKTHKASAKRFKATGGKKAKFMRRKAGQGHFNAREDGNTVRLKRKDQEVHPTDAKRLKVLLPYLKAK